MMVMIMRILNSEEEKFMDGNNIMIPIPQKAVLSVREAAAYTNIGINKIDSMLRKPNCPFVLFVGTKKLVKRKEFEEYLSKQLVI